MDVKTTGGLDTASHQDGLEPNTKKGEDNNSVRMTQKEVIEITDTTQVDDIHFGDSIKIKEDSTRMLVF